MGDNEIWLAYFVGTDVAEDVEMVSTGEEGWEVFFGSLHVDGGVSFDCLFWMNCVLR